jgi:hypothetical protein
MNLKMKSLHYTILSGFMLASFVTLGQETEVIYSNSRQDRPMKTLVGSDKGFGGHLSLNVRANQVYDEATLLLGGELVFTLDHSLNIGVAGYGMPSRVDYRSSDAVFPQNYNVELGYGGLLVEPVFFDQEVVHFTVPVLIGAGWSGLTENSFFGGYGGYYDWRLIDETIFFVFEPGLNMEVNLARNVKFTLGATYRLVEGSDLREVTDSDLSGFTLGGGIRVGWF